jgi:hypothetical protein
MGNSQCVAACVVCAFLALPTVTQKNSSPPDLIRTSEAGRAEYLATATIWRDPGPLTPEEIRAGPPADVPDGMRNASVGPIECRYDRPGTSLGGHAPKFSCRTLDGQSLRVKYYDASEGNREVFAEVVATRLVWALGFDADAMFPSTVKCLDCPERPSHGTGSRGTREYVAAFEPHYRGTVIASTNDMDQGWSFAELEQAIEHLPTSSARLRQRTQFDALSLLAVFMQHGDRKPSQQRLTCRGDLDLDAGQLRDVTDRPASESRKILFEHPGAHACRRETVVTLQDIGATFGGAGQTTNRVTAKMHLESWAAKPVFVSGGRTNSRPNEPAECRGSLNASGTAGSGARENPRISEAGRAFLAAQFARLTPEHIRALFQVAQVDALHETHVWRDRSGTARTGVDAWVAVFLDKVRQIAEQRCAP